MNEAILFNTLRQMSGSLSQIQVDSVHSILNACARLGVIEKHQIAYILATAFHESRLKPVMEVGLGQGRDYGKKLKMGGGAGKRIPYTTPDKLYYGRGFVQLTWYENYDKFGKLLGIDLLNKPELTLQPDYAAEIIVLGMQKGLFTGVGLSKYFHDSFLDPISARKIVNGLDKAELISGYYGKILAAFE